MSDEKCYSEDPANKRIKKTNDNQNEVKIIAALEDLPNEILVKISDYLKINDLIRCGQVSKRIRSIANNELLWQKINLKSKDKILTGFLQRILKNGCQYLFTRGELVGKLQLNDGFQSHLKFLSARGKLLKHSTSDDEILDVLIASCHSLELLSLVNVNLGSSMILSICIQNGKTLKSLQLTHCKDATFAGNGIVQERRSKPKVGRLVLRYIQPIVDYCAHLEELDLNNTHLSEESVDYLAKNLTPSILKLCLYQVGGIKDEHVNVLVRRCNKLTELNLCQSRITNRSVDYIIENLKSTLEKLDLTSTEVDLVKLYELKTMEKLIELDFLDYKHVEGMEELRKQLPNIYIGHYQFGIRKVKFIASGRTGYSPNYRD